MAPLEAGRASAGRRNRGGLGAVRQVVRAELVQRVGHQQAEVPGDDLYRLRYLPEGLEFELYIDGKRIELHNDPVQIEDPDKPMRSTAQPFAPHLFVFASGEFTAYEIDLVRPQTGARLVMRGDVLGEIEFGEDDEI